MTNDQTLAGFIYHHTDTVKSTTPGITALQYS
ncbi:hypothetical protein CJA_2326 [Cellvibrio japonicus Ueda107]|uniref:Uncharacterized protein n=1 Tax=Cellvibrio japonicus (strain Ueda107) TaxID=498211 RepID=B3PJW4_CELJU|nr:hypothetical protein CJA_2326 [Cellvibrio japonicus Ueda107]